MNATSRKLPGLTSCEAAPVGVVVDCTTVLATIEVGVVVVLVTNGPESDRLVKEAVAELDVVVPDVVELVLVLAVVPVDVELVVLIELVAVASDVFAVEDATLDVPVPPTTEKRPE
jgi:hypothetical protein